MTYSLLADPNGVSTFRAGEVRLGWVPSVLRGRGVPTRSGTACAPCGGPLPSGVPQHRRLCHPSFRRPGLTKPRQRFPPVHPSSLSLARFALMGRPLLRRYLELCTPSLPTTRIKIGNRRWTLAWDKEASPSSPHPLIRCDRVSQGPCVGSRPQHTSAPPPNVARPCPSTRSRW